VHHPLSGLSDSTRQMVLAILPWSIAVPADKRHAAQEAAVCMIGNVVETVQTALQKAVDVEAGKVDELRSARAELQCAVQQAESADIEARQALEKHSGASAQAEAAVSEQRAVVHKVELEETRLGVELEQTKAQLSELEAAVVDKFPRLRDGSCEGSEAEGLVQEVMAASAKFALEESLMLALPATLAKRERGAFDEVVIGQAEQSLRGKLESMAADVEAASNLLAAQAPTSQVAQSGLDAALADQTQAAETLRAAEETVSQAKAAEEAAKCALAQHEPKSAAAEAVLQARREELEQFCAYNVCIFSLLRDRVQEETQGSSGDSAVDTAGGSAVDTEDVADAACNKGTLGSVEDSVAGMAGKEANIVALDKEPAVVHGTETASLAGA